jgi:hypothetical protein
LSSTLQKRDKKVDELSRTPLSSYYKPENGEIAGKFSSPQGMLETTHREPVGTIVVVVRVHVGRIQVQIAGVRTIRTRRPVVAVATLIVDRGGRTVIAVTSKRCLGDDWICVYLDEDIHLLLLLRRSAEQCITGFLEITARSITSL